MLTALWQLATTAFGDIICDIAGDISDPAAGLLMKAIRTLPPDEQDAVLTYLLERALSPAAASPAPLDPAAFRAPGELEVRLGGSRPVVSPTPGWHHLRATQILRRLGEGAGSGEIASEAGVDLDALRLALGDVARRSPESSRRARLFALLAGERTIADAGQELGLSEEEVAAELAATKELIDALSATLMARTLLDAPPERPGRGPLRTMPVRFPEQQYERLKRWCEDHDFPMAVVVRGVVEHFLDQQERRTP
ncbi:MAG: hypothetical protein M3076_06890 [Actinomycetota bacterium]|nr:hypothetical protein [Actinomycetota bacterium]